MVNCSFFLLEPLLPSHFIIYLTTSKIWAIELIRQTCIRRFKKKESTGACFRGYMAHNCLSNLFGKTALPLPSPRKRSGELFHQLTHWDRSEQKAGQSWPRSKKPKAMHCTVAPNNSICKKNRFATDFGARSHQRITLFFFIMASIIKLMQSSGRFILCASWLIATQSHQVSPFV